MSNEERHNVTDLPLIRKQEIDQPYLDFAKEIVKLIKQGETKEAILHEILSVRGGLEADPREMQFFTDMTNIVYEWYRKIEGQEFKDAIKELLAKMEENQKYLYKGKDGNDYATRAELEAANEDYVNRKNPTRGI